MVSLFIRLTFFLLKYKLSTYIVVGGKEMRIKTKIKKLCYVICSIMFGLTCLLPIQDVKANQVVSKVQLIEPNVYVRMPMKNGGIFTSILGYVYANDQLVYCVEPYKLIDSGASLTPSDFLSEAQRNEISLISHFGYNKSDRKSDAWYMATQLMIWESLGHSFQLEGFADYANYKAQINKDKQDFYKLPSFHDAKVTLKANENTILNDTHQVFAKYKHLNHKGKAEVKKDNQSLQIKAVNNAYEEGEIHFQKLSDDEVGLPIVYKGASDSGIQSVIYPRIKQNVSGKLTYRVQPYGTFSLHKVANQFVSYEDVVVEGRTLTKMIFADEVLANAKVNVYAKEDITDVWENVIHKKDELIDSLISTQKNTTKPLLAGKYYAKEVETQPGFVLDDKHYDFTIDNTKPTVEDVKLNLINKRAKVKLNFKKQFEAGSLLDLSKAYEDVRFAIYTKTAISTKDKKKSIPANAMVYYSGIDANGELLEPIDLPLGSYVLKEVQTNEHYVLDENEYAFDVVDNQNEVIEIDVNEGVFENKLKRVSLNIHKIGDDKQPLQAKFALYDANQKELMTFMTKEDGSYLIENLVQGTYYVKELQAPKGYEYANEMHEIVLQEDAEYTITNAKMKERKAIQTSDGANHRVFTMSMLASMTTMYAFVFKKLMKF